MLRRKNNYASKLVRGYNVRDIVRKEMTTRSDLEFLAKKMGIDGLRVTWLKDADPTFKGPQIINMGSTLIGGTHWVATYNGQYFDSFGLVPPPKLSHLSWVPLHIQDIKKGYCGNYAMLWLWYAIHDEIDQFYNLFNKYNV